MWFNFRLTMTSSDSFFGVINNNFPIPRGFKTVLKVKPTSIISDQAVRDVPIDERKCLFDDEFTFDFSFLRNYSTSGCHFECMFKYR